MPTAAMVAITGPASSRRSLPAQAFEAGRPSASLIGWVRTRPVVPIRRATWPRRSTARSGSIRTRRCATAWDARFACARAKRSHRFITGNPSLFEQGAFSVTIVERMRTQLTAAMKAGDAVRTNFLRYWIAQLTLGSGAEMPENDAIKKMRSVLKEAKAGVTTWSPEELALIRDWVPPVLSIEQIEAALAPLAEQIKAAPKEGMA